MRITYFACDFIDPASTRRVQILRQGGAQINLLGFRRSVEPVTTVDGIPAIDLGRTYHGRMGDRIKQVFRRSLDARHWRDMIAGSDCILARNLEMATIASAARAWAKSEVPLVYECLDIHSTQLSDGLPSKLLRRWEQRVLAKSSGIVLSSPSHLNYFNRFGALPPVIWAENKRFMPDGGERPACSEREPPWRIGWFGALRCTESFEHLCTLARRYPKHVDVTLRGRPHPPVQSLIDQHLPLPNMRFEGPYTQADLGSIYGACDLTWAIEYAGQNATNAKWALGNRLYEGGFYNCPSIALAGTAMADWLIARGTGIVISDPLDELGKLLVNLTPSSYRALQQSAAAVPTSDLVWSTEDCRAFVHSLVRR